MRAPSSSRRWISTFERASRSGATVIARSCWRPAACRRRRAVRAAGHARPRSPTLGERLASQPQNRAHDESDDEQCDLHAHSVGPGSDKTPARPAVPLNLVALTIGIVGLPNVGKSTLFNALTKNDVLAANYPFATIEPNIGVVGVPDPRLAVLAKIHGSAKLLPATVSFVDIAGIVRGATEGEGLGNKFLANIREGDAICQVIRGVPRRRRRARRRQGLTRPTTSRRSTPS